MTEEEGGLVLGRKLGQEILIEHGLVRIQVIRIKGKHVWLRFQAKNVKIDRAEMVREEPEES